MSSNVGLPTFELVDESLFEGPLFQFEGLPAKKARLACVTGGDAEDRQGSEFSGD